MDPLRPGHELRYHPGETNLRMADVVVVNKVDTAASEAIGQVIANIEAVNPMAQIVKAASPVVLEEGPSIVGETRARRRRRPDPNARRHAVRCGTVVARQGGALELVDPRPFAVGTIGEVLERYPEVDSLPAMGYSRDQLQELETTINAATCDVVVTGTPIDLGRLIESKHPIRHARYELKELGSPTLDEILTPLLAKQAALAVLI